MTTPLGYALLAIAGVIVFNTFFVITQTGKPRKALTPGDVAAVTAVNAIVITVLTLAALKLH